MESQGREHVEDVVSTLMHPAAALFGLLDSVICRQTSQRTCWCFLLASLALSIFSVQAAKADDEIATCLSHYTQSIQSALRAVNQA